MSNYVATVGCKLSSRPRPIPSGERVAWELDDEPAQLAYAELRNAVARLAARVVAIRHGDGTATDEPATSVFEPIERARGSRKRCFRVARDQSPNPTRSSPSAPSC